VKAGVLIFPGSNCDHDILHVMEQVLGIESRPIWHKDTIPSDFDSEDWIILPGGFSYGDYMRCGAIARYSEVMKSVTRFAKAGGNVLGICNGFQILCESHLLPGVLLRNRDQNFICKNIHLSVQSTHSDLTSSLEKGEVLSIPIAHAEGRYYADAPTLDELKSNDQILFKYCDSEGKISAEANVNGSLDNIAGICNIRRNVFGMMPHPERASDAVLGNEDGLKILQNLLQVPLYK